MEASEGLGNEGFRRVTQIGIVVENIEEARAAWAELLGVEEPPITETESRESTHMMFRDKPSGGGARLAFFKLENIVVELIQPLGGPSTWQEFTGKCGKGIHHVAFSVENLESLADLSRMGINVEQKGEYRGGCYVYADSQSKLGAIVELLHRHG